VLLGVKVADERPGSRCWPPNGSLCPNAGEVIPNTLQTASAQMVRSRGRKRRPPSLVRGECLPGGEDTNHPRTHHADVARIDAEPRVGTASGVKKEAGQAYSTVRLPIVTASRRACPSLDPGTD
jgi:hypothetical protein